MPDDNCTNKNDILSNQDLLSKFESAESIITESEVEEKSEKIKLTPVINQEKVIKEKKHCIEEIVLWKSINKETKNEYKGHENVFLREFEYKVRELQRGISIYFNYCSKISHMRLDDNLNFFLGLMRQFWGFVPVKLHRDYCCDISADSNNNIVMVLRWDIARKNLASKKDMMRLIYRLKSKNEKKNISIGVYSNMSRIERSSEIGFKVIFINKDLRLPPIPVMSMAS
ncbi:MAG: hypothetical protein HOJ35_06765 [Bdellovibrionales bacterium]|nr:hypothetical protein [Bdellovibrionales bacterium]